MVVVMHSYALSLGEVKHIPKGVHATHAKQGVLACVGTFGCTEARRRVAA